MQHFSHFHNISTTDALYIKFTTETQQADGFCFIICNLEKALCQYIIRRFPTNLTEVDYENSIPDQKKINLSYPLQVS